MRHMQRVIRELGCSRTLLMKVMKLANETPLPSGNKKVVTEEQFQNIKKTFQKHYPGHMEAGLYEKEECSMAERIVFLEGELQRKHELIRWLLEQRRQYAQGIETRTLSQHSQETEIW